MFSNCCQTFRMKLEKNWPVGKDGLPVWPAGFVSGLFCVYVFQEWFRFHFTPLSIQFTLHVILFCFHFLSVGSLSESEKMGAPSKPFISCLICLAVVLLVFGSASASEFDPYRVLGLSRHASQVEIRKAYKQLVKEWWVIVTRLMDRFEKLTGRCNAAWSC